MVSNSGGKSWATYTIDNGIGDNTVNGVFFSGPAICAATDGGLSLSSNGGGSWTTYTRANGLRLGNDPTAGVYVSGLSVYVTTRGSGLSVSQ